MRLVEKLAATADLLSAPDVSQALRDLCQQRLAACGETYETGRDIEQRIVRDEIDEELADAVNIAAMGNRAGRFDDRGMRLVRRAVVVLWRNLHPEGNDPA